MHNRIVVFAPHPDDETLGCGATIVQKLGEGCDVIVVAMTDGRHSHDHVLRLTDPPPATIKSIRRGEFKGAMEILGVKKGKLHMWSFEDGELGQHFEAAVRMSTTLLTEVQPSEVYVTYRNDRKSDHESAFQIVSESLEQLTIPTTIIEYPIWSRVRSLEKYRKQSWLVVEVGSQLAFKKDAINAYRSQTTRFFPKQQEPILHEHFIGKFLEAEVFLVTEPGLTQ